MNICMKLTVISGYLLCRIYNAGKVNIAPATITPEHAPMDCIMTFSPRAFLRFARVDIPTAIMAIGIAASKTCPTLRPRYAAAAEKSTAMAIPHDTDQKLTSGYTLSGDIKGRYTSPSFNGRKAFSGSPVLFLSSCFIINLLFYVY